MVEPQLKSERIDVEDYFEWLEMAYQRRWTDGLPVVPPTEKKVAEMIEYIGREPHEVVGIIPPANGIATIEKIAINAVMGGCLPQYLPVVLAALEAMLEPSFNLNGVQATAHSCAPLTIVSGPIVQQLGFNCKDGVFAGGSRANTTVGRAIRLILWNIGGGYTGDIDKASFGHAGRFTFCIAENQEANPWEPLHVERGLRPEDSAVTVMACEAPRWIKYGLRVPAVNLLMNLADAMGNLGNNSIYIGGQYLLVIGSGLTPTFAREGWSKAEVRQYLFENARRPLGLVKKGYDFEPDTAGDFWPKWVDINDNSCMIPAVKKPEDIIITVAGGAAGNVLCPGWHAEGGFAVTKPIKLPS